MKMCLPINQRKSGLGKVVQSFFVVLGVVLLGFAAWSEIAARMHQVDQSRRFEESLKEPGTQSRPLEALPSTGTTLGRLRIRRIGLDVIVEEGDDELTLKHAVGHIRGTALPGQHGNAALAGHRDTFFRPLSGIRPDDEITFQSIEGTKRYKVESTRIVVPEDLTVLGGSFGDVLTLVTCYPFRYVGPAPMRFIIRARLIT